MASGVLPELVLAHHTEVRGAEVDIGRDVGGADQDHPHAVLLDQQAPPQLLLIELGNPGPGEELEAALQQHAGADRDRDAHRTAPEIWPTTCSGGRRRVFPLRLVQAVVAAPGEFAIMHLDVAAADQIHAVAGLLNNDVCQGDLLAIVQKIDKVAAALVADAVK